MKVRNNQKFCEQWITIRKKVGKTNKPSSYTMVLPRLSTAEIPDEDWKQAWAASVTRPETTLVERTIQTGEDDAVHQKEYTIQERVLTGRTETVYPLRDLVRDGHLTILTDVANDMSDAHLAEAIQAEGFAAPANATRETLLQLYNKLNLS